MWSEAKAVRGLTLMSDALVLLEEIGEATLAAHLSLVVERLREKIDAGGAIRPEAR